jgi:hypothetical protein
MRAPGMIHLALLSLLAASGCSLLVSAELEDKPDGTGGAGGAGGESGTSTSSASSTTKTSSTAASSGGDDDGGSCPGGMTTCPGNPNVCKIDLKSDPMNCGACNKVCFPPTHCAAGMCK